MRWFVVPPHADFTVAWEAPAGFEVLDLARAFAERVASGEAIREELAAIGEATDPDACRRRVSLEVARALLSRPRSARTHLRALGAALSGLSRPGSGVRLRLDDLDLEHGSTERLGDALAVSRGPLPFALELEDGLAKLSGAEVVRLWLERDQQLPAALAIAARLLGVSLELAGPFARTHREALRCAFPRACWVEEQVPCTQVGAPGSTAEPWGWERREPRGWAGTVSPVEVLFTDALAESGARVLIVPFCAWDDAVVAVDGTPVNRSALELAIRRLKRSGVKVAGEWWVGAPGIGSDRVARTLEALRSAPLDWLVGVRPFHWTRGRTGTRFGALEVQVDAAPADRDLWRSHPFRAPGTLSAEALATQLEALPLQLLAQGRALSPGRVAQASVSAPDPLTSGPRVRVDPDCALVSVAVALDGRPGPVTYAVNLRNGVTMAIDPRLVPAVRSLESPVPAAQALSALGAQREKVLRALLAKGVLAEVA